MLMHESQVFLNESMELYEKLEYLLESDYADARLQELYKEFKRIWLLESVTDSIQQLIDFMDMFGSEIDLKCDKGISVMKIKNQRG